MAETRAPTEPPQWDPFAIRAEIGRRGLTLTGIARDAGLYESACRQALAGRSLAGAQAISRVLGLPVETLFPDQYGGVRRYGKAIAPPVASDSPKAARRADSARAA